MRNLVLLLSCITLVGCGFDETNCGTGTTVQDGECVPAADACEAGTELVDGVCVAADDVCAAGTELVDGVCVAADDVCAPGTELVDGVCVAADDACGPGTELFDGVCVAADDVCAPGTIYDTATRTCLPACGDGTELLVDGVCVALDDLCAPGERYDTATGTCLTICGDGTELGSDECIGWPWNELTIDTVCARRAFYICDAMFDPVCACSHGGDAFGGGPDPTDPIAQPATFGACVNEEVGACSVLLQGLVGDYLALGQVTVSQAALGAFDAHYATDVAPCTRPSGWEILSIERITDLAEGAIPLGGSCFEILGTDSTCQSDGYCDGLTETCLPKRLASEVCDAPQQCAAGLLCQPDSGECEPPRVLGESCATDNDCGAGLYCFPADLDVVDGPGYVFLTPLTCQNPQDAGAGCLADPRFISGVGVETDVCGAGLRCDDAARSAPDDGVGQCVSAVAEGGACDLCAEVQLFTLVLGGSELDPFTPAPFTSCGDGLTCALDATGGATCQSEVSVCLPTWAEIYGPGEICGP